MTQEQVERIIKLIINILCENNLTVAYATEVLNLTINQIQYSKVSSNV